MFDFQIFNDSEDKELSTNLQQSSNIDAINTSFVEEENDENYINDENLSLYTSLDQQFEELLMVSSLSSESSSFVSDISPKQEFENPFYDYFQSQNSNSSPMTNKLDIFYDLNGTDSDYNSLDDYSSISNIIYTNKMKEKLRRKRHSSTEIPPTKVNKNANVNTHTKSRSKTIVPSLNLKYQSATRNKSCVSIASQSILSMSLLPSPASSTTSLTTSSPSAKAVNPFYQPPAILRQLKTSE